MVVPFWCSYLEVYKVIPKKGTTRSLWVVARTSIHLVYKSALKVSGAWDIQDPKPLNPETPNPKP